MELLKGVLKDNVSVFTGPFDFAIFQRQQSCGLRAKYLDGDLLKRTHNHITRMAWLYLLFYLGKQVYVMDHHSCIKEHNAFQLSWLFVDLLEFLVNPLNLKH